MELTIPEKFILLSLNNKKGNIQISLNHFNYGLAGAVLLELAKEGYITLKNKKINPTGSKWPKNQVLKNVYSKINASKRRKMARTWIQKLAFSIKKIKEPFFSNLIQNGIIFRREHRFAGLIRYSRYPVREKKLKESIISEIRELVLEDKTTSNDLVLLACLSEACQFTRKIFINRDERKIARKKIKKLMKENEMTKILSDTLAQINAAIIASISVAAAASTSGSS